MNNKESRKSKRKVIVLNVGASRPFLERREEILADAGFAVVSTPVNTALAAAHDHDVRLAIFGHLVHPADRLKISEELRRKNPAVRLVVMYDHSVKKTESADAVLQINVPPADLVHTVEYLLSDKGLGAAFPS